MSPNREELEFGYSDRALYQSHTCVPYQWHLERRERFDHYRSAPADDQKHSDAPSAKVSCCGVLQRWFIVSPSIFGWDKEGLLIWYNRACVISMVRLHSLIPLLHAVDVTWANADAAIWMQVYRCPSTWHTCIDRPVISAIELCVVVTCGCLSVIRPFLRHVFPILMTDASHQTSRTKYSNGKTNFFLYNKRNRAGQSGSTGSVTQLGQPYLDSSWNNTEYIQDIRATRTADPTGYGKIRSTNDDMEMGAIKGDKNGDIRALSRELPQEGIMIKKEVAVQRK